MVKVDENNIVSKVVDHTNRLEEICNEFTNLGMEATAVRLKEINGFDDGDGIIRDPINLDSLNGFLYLTKKLLFKQEPFIGQTDDGIIGVRWKIDDNQRIKIRFFDKSKLYYSIIVEGFNKRGITEIDSVIDDLRNIDVIQ